jgi:magnesium transporter
MEKAGTAAMLLIRVYDENCTAKKTSVNAMTRKLAMFIGDKFLIAVHRKDLPFLADSYSEWKNKKNALKTPLTEIMLDILLSGIETYHKPLEMAELLISQYENSVFKDSSQKHWQEIFVTKSRLMVIKRMLWHTLNAVQKFLPNSQDHLAAYQDLKERIESLMFFCDSLLDNLNNLLNIQISLASHSTNEVMRWLTLFSVVFMPLTFIVGIYGMNFENMPGLKSPNGFWIVTGAMIVTALAIYFWFRRRGWVK